MFQKLNQKELWQTYEYHAIQILTSTSADNRSAPSATVEDITHCLIVFLNDKCFSLSWYKLTGHVTNWTCKMKYFVSSHGL